MKTAKTPGKRTRENTSIFFAANLKLLNQADTLFVGILRRKKILRRCCLSYSMLSANTKAEKKKKPSTKKNLQYLYIFGFDPGFEYQRVLALDVDNRATHLLQLEASLKIVSKAKNKGL